MLSKSKVLSLVLYNESCERFCFYGLRSLLFIYLRTRCKLPYISALTIVHLFMATSYSLPFVAGIVLDMLLGSYRAILNLSLVYFVGTIMLAHSALTEPSTPLVLLALVLIAVGIGGLKPCIAMSSIDGLGELEQVGQAVAQTGADPGGAKSPAQDHLHSAPLAATEAPQLPTDELPWLYTSAYFVVYFCAALSIVWSPLLADISCFGAASCYALPFSLSSLLLGCSIVLLVIGTRYFSFNRFNYSAYRSIARAFGGYVAAAARRLLSGSPSAARVQPGEPEFVLDLKQMLRLVKFFMPIVFFWMLVDQQYTNWIEQGLKMQSTLFSELLSVTSSFPTFNSLIMILIVPFITLVIYILLCAFGYRSQSFHNATLALSLGTLSFMAAALLELVMQATRRELSIIWQIPQYSLMSLAELTMGMSGIAVLYKEVPGSIKEIVLCAWLLAVAAGNLAIVLISYACSQVGLFPVTNQFTTYAVFAVLGAYAAFKMNARIIEYCERPSPPVKPHGVLC